MHHRTILCCVFALIIVTLMFDPSQGHDKDQLYPEVLLNWEIQEPFHALIVDKSQQTEEVWKTGNGEPLLVESFRCSTGEKDGDKQTEGDMRTPEGIYFFCKRIDGRRLAPKYGICAFTTDYPNAVDKNQGKTGYGIWLHGRDKPLDTKPDSNGCVSLENQDLTKLSHYIQLQRTPLIIVRKLNKTPKAEAVAQERRIRQFLNDWIQDLKSCDLTKYMGRYSLNFRSGPFRYESWKRKIRKRFEKKSDITCAEGPMFVCAHNRIASVVLPLGESSDSLAGKTTKVLYVSLKEKPLILAEEVRNPVHRIRRGEPVLASAPAHTPIIEDDPDDVMSSILTVDETERTNELDTQRVGNPESKNRTDILNWNEPL